MWVLYDMSRGMMPVAIFGLEASEGHVDDRVCEDDLPRVDLLVLPEICKLSLDLPVFHYDISIPALQILVAPKYLLLVHAYDSNVALKLMILAFQSLKSLEHLLLRVSLHAHYLFYLAAKLVQVQVHLHLRFLLSFEVWLHPCRGRVLGLPLSEAV